MSAPDVILFHCLNTDLPQCEYCPRDFALPIQSVAMIAENGGGKAVIQTNEHIIYHPLCGQLNRSIQTVISYEEFLTLFDGKEKKIDVGDVNLVYYKDTFD